MINVSLHYWCFIGILETIFMQILNSITSKHLTACKEMTDLISIT